MVRRLLDRAAMRLLKQTRSGRARLVWVRCDCGESFRHTASRPVVACFHCGRTVRLGRLAGGTGARRRRGTRAASRPADAARRRSRS